jgi:hypothetical protein
MLHGSVTNQRSRIILTDRRREMSKDQVVESYPKTIFVRVEDRSLIAYKDLKEVAEQEDEGPIGIYELREVRDLRITTSLIPRPSEKEQKRRK